MQASSVYSTSFVDLKKASKFVKRYETPLQTYGTTSHTYSNANIMINDTSSTTIMSKTSRNNLQAKKMRTYQQ
jgi:hypothetical protein